MALREISNRRRNRKWGQRKIVFDLARFDSMVFLNFDLTPFDLVARKDLQRLHHRHIRLLQPASQLIGHLLRTRLIPGGISTASS